ncbi:uncharacterized protein [Mytilus edulis]|uniref:uncharacterized protein isoform X2 n=1 Tax=Mytilus edulis TaxID=6550 RepID=UPI0039F0B100
MIIYTILSVVLFLSCEIETPIKDYISWNLHTKPAVFTNDVQLECKISTQFRCCDEFTRKWSRGKRYDLIVMNGVSLNTAKYKEDLNISANSSTLTIYKFSEYDVNIPYECSYGFDSSSQILELNEENFEHHPEEILPINLTSDGQQVLLNVSLMKVYPAPVCNATDGEKDVTQYLAVATVVDGIFFQSNILFNYTIDYVCHSTIVILCRLGGSNFVIVNGSRPCLKATNYYQHYRIIIDVIIGGTVTVSLILIILLLKCRNYLYTFWSRCKCQIDTRNEPDTSERTQSGFQSDTAKGSLLNRSNSDVESAV